MKKFDLNAGLERTGKTIGSVATIMMGICLITMAACMTKRYVLELLPKSKKSNKVRVTIGVLGERNDKKDEEPVAAKKGGKK